MAYIGDIVARARANDLFREVVATGPHSQLVVMSIPPGGEIGEETHDTIDQVLVIVVGEADTVLEGVATAVGPGDLIQVPAGTRHNIINRGAGDLRLYTVYAPPAHAPGTVHRTRAEAEADEADHYQPAPAG
jgi:mannose-6-phosphate isomerase-like protein (cupin superfamily)